MDLAKYNKSGKLSHTKGIIDNCLEVFESLEVLKSLWIVQLEIPKVFLLKKSIY